MGEQRDERNSHDPSRRRFLSMMTAGVAGSLLAGCADRPGPSRAVPYLRESSAAPAGQSARYASLCSQCPAGCGILVRVVEGRAKKIEGDPEHPISHGRLCALGQAGLQVLYNPDRLVGPMARDGSRWRPISWDAALSRVSDAIGRGGPGVALLSGPARGTRGLVYRRFAEAIGARRVAFSPFAPVAERAAAGASGLQGRLPEYGIAAADLLVSFGADFLERWLSPVHYAHQFGRFRQGRPEGRGTFVYVGPRMSMTAAKADRWLPARPGTEGAVALAVLQSVRRAPGPHTAEWAAETTGLRADDIRWLATRWQAASQPVAIGGGAAAAHSNGAANSQAADALHHVSSQLEFTWPLPWLGLGALSEDGLPAVESLIADMDAGRIEVLIVAGTDPAFELPAAMGFAAAAEKVPVIVSLSAFADDTAELAHMVLPDRTYLERWALDVPDPTPQPGLAALQQPVVRPLYNTRPVEATLASLAQRLGDRAVRSLPWADDEAVTRKGVDSLSPTGDVFADRDDFWRETCRRGRVQNEGRVGVRLTESIAPDWSPPRFAGDEREFPLHLLPYQQIGLADGTGANQPWLQELPDPVTSVVWGSWVELHPDTARRLGASEGDLVSVESEHGSFVAPAIVHPGLRPEVVAVPVGQGHGDGRYGSYAEGRGANPVSILAPARDRDSGAFAWAATRVRLRRVPGPGRMVKMADRPKPLPDAKVIEIARQ